MPFLRFSRDKRGYEHTYLVQSTNRRGKPIRPRILYWYRTPPGVKLGRSPFDEEVRKTLEANNPGVTFDWTAIVNTPFPPPDPAEIWRERRRAEKAARQARREAEQEETAATDGEEPAGVPAEEPNVEIDLPSTAEMAEVESDFENDTPPPETTTPASPDAAPGTAVRKRRRRGGRRRRGRTEQTTGASDLPGSEIAETHPEPPAATDHDESEADE